MKTKNETKKSLRTYENRSKRRKALYGIRSVFEHKINGNKEGLFKFAKLNLNRPTTKSASEDYRQNNIFIPENSSTPEDKASSMNETILQNIEKAGTTGIIDSTGILPISIIGEIEGHTNLNEDRKVTKYEHLIPLIVEAEQSPNIAGVLFILNTMGGDVEAGLAISELIAGMSKPTVSLVLGGSHSIGVPLAVAADYSFIAPTATMMVHPIRTSGLVIGVSQSFDYLKRMQSRITDFITVHSDISEAKLNKLMLNPHELVNDMGSVLIGSAAVTSGLIDEVGSIGSAIKKLREFTGK